MRLVRGQHYDEMQHLCVDARKDAKDTHCFEYFADVSAEEGPVVDVDVCMDMFEAPNRRGKRALVMQSYEMAEQWCGERHKRVCREEEWEQACEGDDKRPLAYGWKVDKSVCNSGKGWRQFDVKKLYSRDKDEAREEAERLWQGELSGRYAACVSPFGVYDLMERVEEWVTSRKKAAATKGALMGRLLSQAVDRLPRHERRARGVVHVLRDRLPLLRRARHARRAGQQEEEEAREARRLEAMEEPF